MEGASRLIPNFITFGIALRMGTNGHLADMLMTDLERTKFLEILMGHVEINKNFSTRYSQYLAKVEVHDDYH